MEVKKRKNNFSIEHIILKIRVKIKNTEVSASVFFLLKI